MSARLLLRVPPSLPRVVAMVSCAMHCACQREPSPDEKPLPAAASTPPVAPAAPLPATPEPVPLSRSFAESEGRAAVVNHGEKSQWAKTCLIHKACPAIPKAAPCSTSGLAPIDVARLADTRSGRDGEVVAIRGPLAIGPMTRTMKFCGPRSASKQGCCNRNGGSAVLGEGNAVVELVGLNCSGDDSRSCCNAPAFGQVVTVIGKLNRFPRPDYGDWILRDARLCAD